MIKAVIFDFDGVIIDSEKVWLNTKIKTLKKHQIKIPNNINLNCYLGVGSKIFFRKFIPQKIYTKIINNVIRTYKNLLNKAFFKIPKFNKGVLKILKIKDLQFCIVSNNSKNFIIKSLKNYNISKYFKKKFIISLRNTKNLKPLPYGYLLALKKLKCKAEEIIVIEDSLTGIKAAKKAKIKYIFRYNPLKLKLIKSVINVATFLPIKKFIHLKLY
jgi:putative hydrolase of the HAD superfamily